MVNASGKSVFPLRSVETSSFLRALSTIAGKQVDVTFPRANVKGSKARSLTVVSRETYKRLLVLSKEKGASPA